MTTVIDFGQEIRSLEDLEKSNRATITLKEAAEICGVDRRTFAKGVEEGSVPSIRLGRRIIIPKMPFIKLLKGEEFLTHEED